MSDAPDQELIFDITFALSRSAFRTRSNRREELIIVAAEIIRHLALARWTFVRLPPADPH